MYRADGHLTTLAAEFQVEYLVTLSKAVSIPNNAAMEMQSRILPTTAPASETPSTLRFSGLMSVGNSSVSLRFSLQLILVRVTANIPADPPAGDEATELTEANTAVVSVEVANALLAAFISDEIFNSIEVTPVEGESV